MYKSSEEHYPLWNEPDIFAPSLFEADVLNVRLYSDGLGFRASLSDEVNCWWAELAAVDNFLKSSFIVSFPSEENIHSTECIPCSTTLTSWFPKISNELLPWAHFLSFLYCNCWLGMLLSIVLLLDPMLQKQINFKVQGPFQNIYYMCTLTVTCTISSFVS